MKRPWKLRSPTIKLVENDIERQCLDVLRFKRFRVERLHSGTFKSLDGKRFVKAHEKGTPDYIVAHPELPAFYLEVKRPGEHATPEQEQKHIELRLCGFAVFTVDSIEALVERLVEHQRKAIECESARSSQRSAATKT
jgi:hypothetical protein